MPDLVESLNFDGYQHPAWLGGAAAAEAPPAECPWLGAEWLPPRPAGLVAAARAYWAAVTRLAYVLMELTEQSLQLPRGFFTPPPAAAGSGRPEWGYRKPGTLLRLAQYPPAALAPAEGGAANRYGPHTDCEPPHRPPGQSLATVWLVPAVCSR